MEVEFSTHHLLRRLCKNIAQQSVLDPQLEAKLTADLFDTAFSALIGLTPDTAPAYVAPDARAAATEAALAQVQSELSTTTYAELATTLSVLVDELPRLNAVSMPGAEVEQLSGTAALLRLTEHHAVLGFLLGLQGTQLSVRRRQVTHQTAFEVPNRSLPAPLGTNVFAAVPDPFALTNISSTAALLPSECGNPTDPFAGAEDVQDLSSCMSVRPVWNPTATAYAPKPVSHEWLTFPVPLLEMHSDRRRGARPPPLGLPWALLSMGKEPGQSTAFQALEPLDGAASSLLGSGLPGLGGAADRAHLPEAPEPPQELPEANGPCAVWSLEEADLARDALLALQGVHSALMRLRGMLRVLRALPRLSVAGILDRVAAAAELRQQLQLFVAVHLSTAGAASTVPDAAPAAAPAAAEVTPRKGAQGDAGSLRVLSSTTAAANGAAATPSKRLAGSAACAADGYSSDPVLRAFAAAVGEVLRQQVAALQALECERSAAWVRSLQVAGQPGKQVHRRGLTLLQVALHTGRLQSQLQSLAALCWCLPHQAMDPAGETGAQPGRGPSARQQQWENYPRGAALLSYLHQALVEAGDRDLPTMRFLFGRAMQPYLAHLRSWAFTSAPLLPEFSTRLEEAVAPCLDFTPPQGSSGRGKLAVPCDPPVFLQSMHAAFMRAGAQLRLLDSLPHHGKELVAQLASIAEQEAPGFLTSGAGGRAALSLGPLAPGGGAQESREVGEESWLIAAGALHEHDGPGLLLTSAQLQQAAAGVEQAELARFGAVERWLESLHVQRQHAEQAAAAEALGRTASIRERQARAAARRAEVAALQRDSKANLLRQQSDEVAAKRARAAAQRAQQLAEERELLAQAALREHSSAVAELAAVLEGMPQSAPAEATPAEATPAEATPAEATPAEATPAEATPAEAASVAEGTGPTEDASLAEGAQDAAEQQDAEAAMDSAEAAAEDAGPAAATEVPVVAAPEAPVHPAPATAGSGAAALEGAPSRTGSGMPARPSAGALGAVAAASAASSALTTPAVTPKRQRERWQQPQADGQGRAPGEGQGLGLVAQRVLPPVKTVHSQPGSARTWHTQAMVLGEEDEEEEDGTTQRAAPLSVVLEMSVMRSVVSQYRAVSRACVRLFLDELKVLEHLEAMRRLFFMGAGDFGEALVAALGAHADSLAPLTQHGLERMVQDATRGTCLEHDPYAARMRVRLLPGLSVVSAQIQAVNLPTPQKRSKPRVSPSVVLPPTVLDGMDCVALDYEMGWPLSTVITQDIVQGYAAVFGMLVRLKRVDQLLRSLHGELMQLPKSAPDVRLSARETKRAYRRLQQLRTFRHGAAQLVAAVQAFQYSRLSGEGWVQLMAKLMISSEQVAATVLSRGPSAALTGVLSRMSSISGSGSAAHRLVKLARDLSRQGSQLPSQLPSQLASYVTSLATTPAASQPGSPTTATAGAAAAAAAAGSAPAAQQGPGRGSRSWGPSRHASAAASPAGSQPGSPAAAGGGAQEAQAGPRGFSRAPSRLSRASSAPLAAPAAPSGRPAGPSRLSSTVAATAPGPGSEVSGAATAPPALPPIAVAPPAQQGPRLVALAPPPVSTPQQPDTAVAGGGLAPAVGDDGGISDLQELLDLHRAYIRGVSSDCLMFGGNPAVREGVDKALQDVMDFALRLLAAVRVGSAGRAQAAAWVQTLHKDTVWGPLQESMSAFRAHVAALIRQLEGCGSRGVLAELALQLNFSGFYSQ